MVDESATAILRRVSPAWAWVRDNFKLPALLTIAGVIGLAGAGYLEQRGELRELQSREDPKPHLDRIEEKVGKLLEAQAGMRQQLLDFGRRVDEQQHKWERVERVAQMPPRRRR